MAYEDIKDKGFDSRTTKEQQEIAKKGGIASGKARKEKASLRKSLETILNSDIRITQGAIFDKYKAMGIDISNKPIAELVNLGLLYGAVEGNATNYKTIMETNNEIVNGEVVSTPTLKIEITDNSNLEKVLYEANQPNKNDEG